MSNETPLADEVATDALSIDDMQKVGVEPWNGVAQIPSSQFHARTACRSATGVLFTIQCAVPGIAGSLK